MTSAHYPRGYNSARCFRLLRNTPNHRAGTRQCQARA